MAINTNGEDDDDESDKDFLPRRIPTQLISAAAKSAHDQGADDGARAAAKRGATDDYSGDDIEFESVSRDGVALALVGHGQQARQPKQVTSQCIDPDSGAAYVNAAQPRGDGSLRASGVRNGWRVRIVSLSVERALRSWLRILSA